GPVKVFLLFAKSSQLTFLVGSIPLIYFSILVYPSPLISPLTSAGLLGFRLYFRSHLSGIPSESVSLYDLPLYSGYPPTCSTLVIIPFLYESAGSLRLINSAPIVDSKPSG